MSATLGTIAGTQSESQYYGYPTGSVPGPSDNAQNIFAPAGSPLARQLDANPQAFSANGYDFGPAYQAGPNGQPLSPPTATPAVLMRPRRGIAFIIPNIVESEQPDDELHKTEHPVEIGAAITDHAFKAPVRLRLRYNWSNSGAWSSGENYVKQVYAQILALQASATPVTITTGKRTYPNMLLTRISNITEAATEYSLPLDIEAEQVILVPVRTTTLPPSSQQASPQDTSQPKENGVAQPEPVSTSTLGTMFGVRAIGPNPSHGYPSP